MPGASAEAAGRAAPAASGPDAAVFKVLLIGLALACSVTFRPVYLGMSSKHSSLIYGDIPVVAAFAFLALLARLMDGNKVRVPALWMFVPLYLLIAWWGLSGLLYARQGDFFLVSLLQYATGAVLVLAAPWVLVRYRLREYAMEAVMAASLLVSVCGLIECVLQPENIFEKITSITGPNHAHLGLYMLVALAVALHRSYAYGSRRWYPASIAFLAFFSILLSGSRAAQAGSIVILAAYFFRRLNFANFVKLAVAAALMGWVFAYIVKQRTQGAVGDSHFQVSKGIHIDKSAGRRVLMWIVSWQVINSSTGRFVHGIGFTNYRWEYGKSIKLPFYTNAAHNIYIHVWTETGLVGLLLYLASLGAIFVNGWRRRNKDPAAILQCALVGAIMVTGLTQETLYPNEAMCNFNVLFHFACLLMALPAAGGPAREALKVVEARSVPA